MIVLPVIKFFISTAVIAITMWFVFFAIRKLNSMDEEKMSDECFVVTHSKGMAIIGIVVDIILAMAIIGVTFSQQISGIVIAIIFYGVFGLCFWGGVYFVLMTAKYKVIVNDKGIRVVPVFEKPYTFMFSDIVSAERKESITHYGELEKIVIKTYEGRKLKVENIQVSYERFLETIKSNVSEENLIGFDNEHDDCPIKKNHSLLINCIKESIKLLASPPEVQLSLCPGKIGEIATTLGGWLLIYENDPKYRHGYFSRSEYRLISDLNKLVSELGEEQWTEDAIKTSRKWEEVRMRAGGILNMIGIEYSVPDKAVLQDPRE